MLQRTIKKSVRVQGIGVHSGKEANVTLHPAHPGHGIAFFRSDLSGSEKIPANYLNVVDTRMATTLARGEAKISTVEHLMAALYGAGIDNLLVEVDGPEVPILDGSSAPFTKALEAVGTTMQLQPRTFLALRKKVEVKAGEKWAYAEPSDTLRIHSTIEWDHPVIGYQEFHYVEGETKFAEIAGARTFGFLRDVEAMWKMGLCRGGSLENAVVLDEARVLNQEGLRYADEFVRHKVLDALGDFKLSGYHLQAQVRLHRSGHDIHRLLLAEILKDASNYDLLTMPSHIAAEEDAPKKAGKLRAAISRASRIAASF